MWQDLKSILSSQTEMPCTVVTLLHTEVAGKARSRSAFKTSVSSRDMHVSCVPLWKLFVPGAQLFGVKITAGAASVKIKFNRKINNTLVNRRNILDRLVGL